MVKKVGELLLELEQRLLKQLKPSPPAAPPAPVPDSQHPQSAQLDALIEEIRSLRETNKLLLSRIDELLKTIKSIPTIHVPNVTVLEEPVTASDDPDNRSELTHPRSNYEEADPGGILILSDSIFRHVGVSSPKPTKGREGPIIKDFTIGASTPVTKVVVPGATCPRLFSEAVGISKQNQFSRVILHVGANYIRNRVNPERAINEICDLLDSLSGLFPSAIICFSLVLPQFRGWQLHAPAVIARINNGLMDFCCEQGYDIFSVNAFFFNENNLRSVQNLLARDGCHLNKHGIDAFSEALDTFVKYSLKYVL